MLRRLACIAHVVDQKHAFAAQLPAVKRPKRKPAGWIVVERSKAAGRVRERPAAVQQSRDGMREQRTAGHRARDDFRPLHQIGRQDVNEILRESPNRRGMAEELMWIQIHPAVIAVRVVEVAVEHQDL